MPTSQGRRPRRKEGKQRQFDASHSNRAQAERDKQRRLGNGPARDRSGRKRKVRYGD